jgi:hypothetical protein
MAGLLLLAAPATALSVNVGDAYYLGYIDRVTPANPASEVSYINSLANLELGESRTEEGTGNGANANRTFSREDSTLLGEFPTAILEGRVRTGNRPGPSDTSGFFFLIVKYGTVAHVWVVSGLSGSIELPERIDGNHLSHYTMYRAGAVGVPDGGATLGFLGFALLGLGALRRRMA